MTVTVVTSGAVVASVIETVVIGGWVTVVSCSAVVASVSPMVSVFLTIEYKMIKGDTFRLHIIKFLDQVTLLD